MVNHKMTFEKPKFQAIHIALATWLCASSTSLLAKNPVDLVPDLCTDAREAKNYNTDFLDNFLTLKQGNKGWLFRDEDLKTSFGPNNAGLTGLMRLKNNLEKYGTQLVMVPIPTRGIIHPEQLGALSYDVQQGRLTYQRFLENLRKIGIVVPKLHFLFTKPRKNLLFFARDHHWNHNGARQIAKLTSKALVANPAYAKLTKNNFKTRYAGNQNNNGSLQRAAETICGSAYPNEIYKEYRTENIDDVDPFAEGQAPQVVLVGTSNSNGNLHFNFDGFIRQYSHLDIINFAESGGGYGGAIKQYLTSEHFKNTPPLFIIWELPSYYSLSNGDFFDELLLKMGEPS